MKVFEKEIQIPRTNGPVSLLAYFKSKVIDALQSDEIPVRFAVTRTDNDFFFCELAVLGEMGNRTFTPKNSIFEFRKRAQENIETFNAVFIVPTGIGAEIGGHSGDATPVARLLAASCDTLITHPNIANAADINELPENALYVEGSVLAGLLMGTMGLQPVRANRIILIIGKHPDTLFVEMAINAASAGRAVFGLDCSLVIRQQDSFLMKSLYSRSGRAVGVIQGVETLCEVLHDQRPHYDAAALTSLIQVPKHFHSEYFRSGNEMVNPWGGVEAMLTHTISLIFNIPTAHAPMMTSREVRNLELGVVDPRKSSETISSTYLYSTLKGLHRSPRIVCDPPVAGQPGLLTTADISCLVIPNGCVGIPTLAAMEQGIPVIAVKENRNRMKNDLASLGFPSGKLFIVENFLEAAGVMRALKAGLSIESVRRPLAYTYVQPDAPPRAGSGKDDLS